MAEITLKAMEFFAYHGCFKEEQVIGTKFKVDLIVKGDISDSEKSDQLSDTIDYQVLYKIVKAQMEIHADLLEHLCRRIIDTVVESFPKLQYVKVKVAKLNPPLGGKLKHVSLTMEYHG
ncbi:dihydroneopterin aldolase [candidate division KSB1 bacterium]